MSAIEFHETGVQTLKRWRTSTLTVVDGQRFVPTNASIRTKET